MTLPAGQAVTVVTSDWHAVRVRYLAQVIRGPGYQVTVEPLADEANTRPPEEIARWDAGLLAVSRRWFAAVLARDHPVYADHPRTTLVQLAAMITRQSRLPSHPPLLDDLTRGDYLTSPAS